MLSFLAGFITGGKLSDKIPGVETQHVPRHDHSFTPWAEQWWDPEGPFKILHRLTPLRVSWIKEQICEAWKRRETGCDILERDMKDPHALTGLRILDLGCGGGLLAEPLARMGAQVTGLDLTPQSIAVAQAHADAQGLGIRYVVGDMFQAAQALGEGAPFDVVIGLEVIEHTADPDGFIAQARRLLAPGGVLLVSTLNRTFPSFALGIVVAERLLGWIPKGTHQWDLFVTPQEMTCLFRRHGLVPGTFQGISFSPLTWSWGLSSTLAVNYVASARLPLQED